MSVSDNTKNTFIAEWDTTNYTKTELAKLMNTTGNTNLVSGSANVTAGNTYVLYGDGSGNNGLVAFTFKYKVD